MTKRICECISDEDFRDELAEFMSRLNSRHQNHLCSTSMLFFASVLTAMAQIEINDRETAGEVVQLAVDYSILNEADLIARANSKIERLLSDGTSAPVN